MPVCLYVSNPFTKTRLQVRGVDLESNIGDFKDFITDTIGIQPHKQELIFMGLCLEDVERSLLSYGVESEVTIYVLQKIEEEKINEEDERLTSEEIHTILNKARNPLYKLPIKKLVKSEDSLRKVMQNISGIKCDHMISTIIKDPDLLLAIIDSASAEDITENHPTLCKLLKGIISNVSIDSTGRQSLFQEDDEEGDFLGIDPIFFTQTELQSAADSNSQQQPSTSHQTLQQQQQQHRISASDLANALSFASMTPATTTSPVSSVTSDTNQESALEQMRAMGITDDDLSRRALMMSGGVIETAVNLIFEGTLL